MGLHGAYAGPRLRGPAWAASGTCIPPFMRTAVHAACRGLRGANLKAEIEAAEPIIAAEISSPLQAASRQRRLPAAVCLKVPPAAKCQDDLIRIAVTPQQGCQGVAGRLQGDARTVTAAQWSWSRFKLALGSIHDRLAVAEQQRIEQRRCRRRCGAIGGGRPVANG